MTERKTTDFEEIEYFTGMRSVTGILSNAVFFCLILFIASIFLPFCTETGAAGERTVVRYWELPMSASLGYCFAGLPAALVSFLKIRFLKADQWRERYVALLAAAFFCLCGAICSIGLLEFAKYEYAQTAGRLVDGAGAIVCKTSMVVLACCNLTYAVLWTLLAKGRVTKERLTIRKKK